MTFVAIAALFLLAAAYLCLPPSAIHTLRALLLTAIQTAILVGLAYLATAWIVFQIRHPAAGQGAFFSEWRAIISFQHVSRYR